MAQDPDKIVITDIKSEKEVILQKDDYDCQYIQVEPKCRWLGCLFKDQPWLNKAIFVRHVKTHIDWVSREYQYVCYWENYKRRWRPFKDNYQLVLHSRKHTGERPHVCTWIQDGLPCKARYSRLENLKTHLRAHRGEKPFVCTYTTCRKAFSSNSDRLKHEKRTHSLEKPFRCHIQFCTKSYTDPSSLRKHIQMSHSKFWHSVQPKTNACPKPPQQLTQKGDLKKKIFLCKVKGCSKAFHDRDTIREHVQMEHAEQLENEIMEYQLQKRLRDLENRLKAYTRTAQYSDSSHHHKGVMATPSTNITLSKDHLQHGVIPSVHAFHSCTSSSIIIIPREFPHKHGNDSLIPDTLIPLNPGPSAWPTTAGQSISQSCIPYAAASSQCLCDEESGNDYKYDDGDDAKRISESSFLASSEESLQRLPSILSLFQPQPCIQNQHSLSRDWELFALTQLYDV